MVTDFHFEAHSQSLSILKQWGFPVNPLVLTSVAIDRAVAYHKELEEKRLQLSYEIDGMVIKVDDLAMQRQLGSTSRSPDGPLLTSLNQFKKQPESFQSKFRWGVPGPDTCSEFRAREHRGVTVSRATFQ